MSLSFLSILKLLQMNWIACFFWGVGWKVPPGLDCASGSVVIARFNRLVPRSAGPRVPELSSAEDAEF